MARRKKVSEEPKWQTVEKIVAILEKILTPAARVEHNVFLPVLGHPEREKRQCDIVVTYGETPRQTIAIVEVQDRKKRPDINTFHGWVAKMREVGAQHLMCVSVLGFPKSIIDIAVEYGPTVRLMTLKELEEVYAHGIVFGNVMIYKKPHFTLEAIYPNIKLGALQPRPTDSGFIRNSDDKVFSLKGSDEKFAALEMTEKVFEVQSLLGAYSARLPDNCSFEMDRVSPEDKLLYMHITDQKYEIFSLSMKWKKETEISLMPMRYLEYKQESLDGTLAWVASGIGEIDGQEIRLQLVFRQDERGFLQSTITQIQGVDNLAIEFYTDGVSQYSDVDKGTLTD